MDLSPFASYFLIALVAFPCFYLFIFPCFFLPLYLLTHFPYGLMAYFSCIFLFLYPFLGVSIIAFWLPIYISLI